MLPRRRSNYNIAKSVRGNEPGTNKPSRLCAWIRRPNRCRRGRVELSYTVTYNPRCFLSVLTQRWGSQFQYLLPYGIANTVVMASIHVLSYYNVNVGARSDTSSSTHQLLGILVSILLAVRIILSSLRYNEALEYVRRMNQNCLKLIETMVVYTSDDGSEEAKQWRNEVAYRTLLLIRTAISICDYPVSGGVKAVDLPEVDGEVYDDLTPNIPPTPYLHEERTDYEENIRIPLRISYMVRKSIRTQRNRLQSPIPATQESELHSFLNNIMDGYQGIVKILTTPVPFPLVQTTIALVCIYLVSLPFVVIADDNACMAAAVKHCIAVFVLTCGLLGLHCITMQLDNPFEDDPNGCNYLALAHFTFEDAYVTIQDVNGEEWADNLRFRLNDNSQDPVMKGYSTVWIMPNEQTGLLKEDFVDIA